MGTRPLHDEEIERKEETLKVLREKYQEYGESITELEEELRVGTIWCPDPGENEQMYAEIQEKVQRWREESEQREVTCYGRLLTDDERAGWVKRPDVVSEMSESSLTQEQVTSYVLRAQHLLLAKGQLVSMVILHFDIPDEKAKMMVNVALEAIDKEVTDEINIQGFGTTRPD